MLNWLEPILFAGTLLLSFFTFRALGKNAQDGWSFPAAEDRWLKGGLVSFLILSREPSLAALLPYWGEPLHRTAALVSLLVAAYALNGLLHRARFHDRLSTDRAKARPFGRLPYRMAAACFLAACALLLFAKPFRAELILAPLAPALLLSLGRAFRTAEWKRIRKRAPLASLYYFYALLAFTAAVAALPALTFAGANFETSAVTLAAFMLVASLLREQAAARRARRARELTEECRQELTRHAAANARLRALCSFVESEWAAVRVTLLSVNGAMGLLIASDGADALIVEENTEPRRLGPFLKRACREDHILYAPVAEELEHDFQGQGLRHSSLAIPFHQEGQVRALLCLMAEEGERIAPGEALVLEAFARELRLEILSATAQFVAEERAAKLFALAKRSDSLAVDHMDSWGHLHLPGAGEVRFLVGAQVAPSATVARYPSPFLTQLHAKHARELRALWRSLASAFEFVPREQQGVQWMISPRDFQNPFLRALGPERAALLLCATLAKLGRQLAERESFLLLGGHQPRLVAGPADVKADHRAPGGIDLDDANRENLQQLLIGGEAGASRWAGRDPAALAGPGFCARATGGDRLGGRDFFSLLGIAADKKELRRLEHKAAEAAREFLKKAA